MSETDHTPSPRAAVPQAKMHTPRRLSVIWLIPLVTAAIAGWIGYRAISEKGPTVQITFTTAEGLEAGKTKIIYKGVQAGAVTSIDVSEDLSQAVIEAEMVKETEGHLTEDTQFWVVRPRIGPKGISGLGTLVSGAYIAIRPGGGKPTLRFEGLEEPPVSDEQGRKFSLRAEQLGSVQVSAPVLHRGITVGEVLKYEFAKDDEGVVIEVLINKVHSDLVRKSSVFWNASGLDLDLGNLFDASVRVGSLESLVAGGIAFANPPGSTEPAPAETVFQLHDERPTALKSSADEGLKLVLTAKVLGGVQIGDQITYRQLPVGKVVETRLAKDALGVEIEVNIEKQHVALVHANSQFWNASGFKLGFGNPLDPSIEVSSLESLVAGGIAFLTPVESGSQAKSGQRFTLLDEQPKDLGKSADGADKGFKVTLMAEDLGGVAKGDPVLYREIEIGQVRETRLSAAADGVEIELEITQAHAALIRANTVFWNASGVKFNMGDLVDASVEIESLKSLLAGGIALANPPDPGPQAAPGTKYELHSKRPEALFRQKKETDALHIVLKSKVQGSVKVDDPILYREVEVGEVSGVALSDDASFVELHVAIMPRYAPLVRTNSVFWNASGIHASFGLFSGADIDIESLSALLRGGIAFATPKEDGKAVANGASFALHREAKKEWQSWAPHIRLPKEAPEQKPSESASQSQPQTRSPKPAAAPEPEAAGDQPATAEQESAPPADESAPLPNSVTLSGGGRVSTSALTEALAKLGFDNISDVQHAGSIARVTADWQGETVKLRIDTQNGRITASE